MFATAAPAVAPPVAATPIESATVNFSEAIDLEVPVKTTFKYVAPTPQTSFPVEEAGPEKVIAVSLIVGVMFPTL